VYQYHVPAYQYHVPMGLCWVGFFFLPISHPCLPISRPYLLPISRPDGTLLYWSFFYQYHVSAYYYQYHVPMGLYCIGLFSTNITSLPTNITSRWDFVGMVSFFYQYHVPLYQYHVPTYQYHVPTGLYWIDFFFLPTSRPDGTLLGWFLFSTNITSLPTNITSRWDFIGMISFFYQYHVPMGLLLEWFLFSTNITSLSTNIMSLPTNITSLRDFIGLISFFYQYHVPMGLCWVGFFFLPISRPDGTLLDWFLFSTNITSLRDFIGLMIFFATDMASLRTLLNLKAINIFVYFLYNGYAFKQHD